MADDLHHFGDTPPPSTIFIELGIENQSDCAIRSIDASKPRGMNIELQPIAERWKKMTGAPNILRRIPEFEAVDTTRLTPGVCNTCFAPCASCWPRHDLQRRPPRCIPTKRYLSCVYVDLPSHETNRVTIEFPTANSEENYGLMTGIINPASDASTQTGGLPGRISCLTVNHDPTTPVQVTLQIDKELDLINASSESSCGSSSSEDAADDDDMGGTDLDGGGNVDKRDQNGSCSDNPDGTMTRSSPITLLDQDTTMIDSDQIANQTQDVAAEEELLDETMPTIETFQQPQPDLFDTTQEEHDHLMRMNAVFGGPPVMTQLEPQPFPIVHDAMDQPSSGFKFSDSFDLTQDEYEQFVAMNAAFGGPAIIPPPKFRSNEPLESQMGPIQQQQPLQQDDYNIEERIEPPPAAINLSDSLDLTQEEYEQFVAMNAAFGGPPVIPPARITPQNEAQPSQSKIPITRPLTLNLQLVETAESNGTPSHRSPGVSRQSAVSFLRHTKSASSGDYDSKQDSVDSDGAVLWEDFNENVVRIELDSTEQEDSDQEDSSLIASSQEDEGSLTPVFDNQPLTFDFCPIGNLDAPAMPSNDHKRIPKGPEFTEELFLSAPTAETGHGDNSVLMRCKIDAWPPAKVSWFYKDEPLGDGDQAVDPDRVELKPDEASGVYTLLLRDVESFDTGVYTCKACNVIGEATSGAELIVQESVSDSEYDTARSYFTSGDEIVDTPLPGGSWLSRGRVRGCTGMVPERTVRITTYGALAPHFIFTPQSRVVEIGQTARLICGVKGSPKPRVSWFSHGVELRSEGRYRVFESEEPGNFVLEIREVKITDAGSYTCTAGNIIGQVYCSTELSVEEFGEPEVDARIAAEEMSSLPEQYLQYGPGIPSKEGVESQSPPPEEKAQSVIPQKLFAMEGTITQLHCCVAGYEKSSVTWYKDGEALVPSEHHIISVDGDNALLTLSKTQLEDEGKYSCSFTDLPHTVLSCCVLVVREAESSTDDRNTPPSSKPIPSAPLNDVSVEIEELKCPGLNQTQIVHMDSLEVIIPIQCSPILDTNRAIGKTGHGSLNEGTDSSNGSGEGAKIRWREKHPRASSRKHKEKRPSRKSSRGINKHSVDPSQHAFLKYDLSESDSSSDSIGQSRKEKTPNRKSKIRKKRSSYSSDLDEEFDAGLERIMALSEKADACLNVVNSVLEMTSLDKEVDEALQEQIFALGPNISESEGSVHHTENVGDIGMDSDTDVDFIKQMAAQKVANAIAIQMMRQANSTNNLSIEPTCNNDLPQEHGFPTSSLITKASSEDKVPRTAEEVVQELAQNILEDTPPVCSTTSTQVQESNHVVENGMDNTSLKLLLNIDTSVETAPASLRNSLFLGPQDKIFTLDEIIDALPETAVDENPHQTPDSPAPCDDMQKFTLIGSCTQSQGYPCKESSLEESPLEESPLEESPLEESPLEESPPEESPLEDSPPEESPIEESPPKVLTQLQDTFVLEGDAMRLEVQVSGFPVPNITWHRDDKVLIQGKNLQLRFDGEDTWALIIRNLMAREGGVYSCTATNTVGSTSTKAVITVAGLVDGPDATDGDEEEQTAEDENPLSPAFSIASPLSLDDDVFMAKANPRDDLPRILLNAEETNIDDINPSQSGEEDLQELTATLTEALHMDRNSNWADESSPDISRSNSTNSDKGTPFHLHKRNRPDSNIEIIRHRKALRKHISRDSTTSIEPCSTGNSDSESDTEGAPKFTKPLQTTEILEGESVQFEVWVTGNPEPKVRWFHDGSELGCTSHHKCSRVEDTPTCYVWRLAISNIEPRDDGRYVCKAENIVGVKTCFAFLIVEGLNANEDEDAADDEDDKKIVSRLLKEREDDQSIGESSQIEEDLLKSFTVESDYSNSSSRMTVKTGDQVELLDGRSNDKWLVRHKTNSNMIGYIPCTLLKRNPSSSSDREDKKIIYNFISKQNSDTQSSNSMKPKQHIIRHLSARESQLSELDEEKMIEDFSDAESAQSYDLYMAVASYTPSPEQKGFIAMAENQVFEVLDSNSALNWLVRGESSPCIVGWVPASYLTPYVSSSLIRRDSRIFWEDNELIEPEEGEEGEEGVREVGNKDREAMMKRGYVLKELLDTERDFVKDLKYVTTHFIPPIQHPNVPAGLKGKKDDIFCNIQEIYEFHNMNFLHELEECENDANSIGRAFIKWQSTFIDLHVVYCNNKPKADTVLTSAAKAFFLQYGGGTGPGQLGLGDYLIKPVQRITKYQLLLKEIIKYTSRAKEDCQELEVALNGMIEVPKRANDLMYLNLIEGFQRDVTELGKLYRQDSFSAWSGKPKGRGKERHLFLFKDILLFTKPKKEVKGDIVGYIYKNHSVVGAINVSEDLSDERRFELSQGRSSPLTLLAKTKYVKEAWVKAIRDLIAEVPKDLREGKTSSERRYVHSPIITSKRRANSMLSPGSSTTLLSEPALNGNFSKSTESLMTLMTLSIPRSGRSSIDSMMASVDVSAFSALVPIIGATYEAVEDLVGDGHETVEIFKGDAVKLLDVCDNLFHIQTIPPDEGSPSIEGYVLPGMLKKVGSIEESPAFTERLKSCLVSRDDSATFTCMFTGKPIPTATWSLPSHLSNDNKRVDIVNTEDSSTLTLYNVTVFDTAEYTCTIENSNGSVSSTAKLDIQANLNVDSIRDISLARSSSPLPTRPPSINEPSLVRSSSLENLKTLHEDFDIFPGEIVRASSISGWGTLNSKRASGMDKIGSFRKHFRKAFNTVSLERDKILHNLQRTQSSGCIKNKQQQQRLPTCIQCKAMRDDVGEDSQQLCASCAQTSLAGSRETLMEEEEDFSLR